MDDLPDGDDPAIEFREGQGPVPDDGHEPGSPTGTFPQGSDVADGTFGYRVPIIVPPGRKGIQPNLALSYQSTNAMGSMGYVGWSLSGLSAIERCARTPLRDGFSDNVDFQDSDNFCLNGNKLNPLSEASWALPSDVTLPAGLWVGGAYAPEDSSDHTRVLALMGAVGEVTSLHAWVVLRPGKRYEWYGETDNSRNWANRHDSGVAATVGWLLSGVEHLGDRIDYSYKEDPTNCQVTNPAACNQATSTGLQQAGRMIDEITYTRWTGEPAGLFGGSSSLRSVAFEWTPLIPTSYRDRWVNGIRMLHTQRLSKIRVYGPGGVLVRTYALNDPAGEFSFRTSRELLATVTTCDAWGTCLPDTTFEYTTQIGPDEDYYAKNVRFTAENVFPLPSGIDCAPRTPNIADVDEDGDDDIFYVLDPKDPHADNQSLLLRSSGTIDGSTFADTTVLQGFVNFGADKFVDIDQDIDRELINVTSDWDSVTFDTYRFSGAGFVSDMPSLTIEETGVWPTNVTLDLDGDGASELVVFKSEWGSGLGPWRINIYQYDSGQWSDGFKGWIPWDPAYDAPDGGGLAHDLDGDGRAELLFGNQYLRVTDAGNLTVAALPWTLSNEHFVDINGDGLPDAVRFDGTTNEQIIRLNTGDGFLPPHVSAGPGVHSNDELNAVRVADFNEDGREDVLVLSMALSGHAQLWLSNGKTLYREDQFDTGIPLDPHLDTSPLHPQAYPGMPQWQGETRFKSVNVMDSNADGILELAVISVEDAVNCSGHYVRQLSQDQSREGVFADRLVKVTDPLGVVEQVSYASLAQAATPCQTTTMGDDDQPLPTLVRCARRGVVVDERQIDHGTDPPRVLEYHYEGARNDIRGRGWLGFAAVQEHDVTAHRKTTYRYHQSALPLGFTCNPGWNCDWTYAYPGLGTPAEVEVVVENDAGTAVLATDTTTYTRTSKLIDLDSARYRTRLEAISRVEDHTGLPGGQVRTSATIFEDFDALDYPRYEVSSGDGGGMLKIERVYQPHDQSEALLGLVATETRTYTRQGTPNVVTTSSRSYDTLGKLEELVLEPQSTDPEIYLRKQFSYRPGHLLERAEEFDLNSSSSRSLELGWNSDGTFVASRTNGLAESTLFEHHLGFGSLYRVTDANGLMQTTDIDSFGRPLVVTDADGGTRTYSYTHIDAARPYAIAAAGSDNSWSQQQLDPLLRPVRVGATGPDGVDLWESIDYDELGRVHARSLPWNAQTPQPPPQSVFGYDELGRPQTTVFADNSTETVQYVGFDQRIVVDAVGNETVVHLDADGLAVQVDERTAASVVVRSHSYDHDARGRVISMADGTPGGEFSATYDVRGRRTDVQEPDTGGKHSQFNAFGQLVYSERSSFESGDVVEWTTYERDAVGRVEALIHHGLSGKSFASRFEYGSGGVDVGRLVAMSRDNDGDDVEDVSTVIGYDSLGHIESRVTQIDGEQYVLSYTYDAEGRLLTSTYPKADGLSPVVRYHYNQWGALETILDDSPTASYGSVLWKAVDYDHGRLALSLKGSAQLVERTYDPLTRRLDSVTTEVAGTPIYAKDFGYYANGQLQSIDDTVMGVTETMTYDALGRLDTWDRAHVTSSFVREFDYDDDRSGVLAGVTDRDSGSTVLREVTYSFEAASPHAVSTTSNLDLLTMTDTQTFAEYDGLGRAIGETRDGELIRDVMEMNGFGLPMLVKSKDGEVTFRYDAQGRRVSRENSALGSRAHYVDDVYEHHVTSSPVEERHVYYIDSPEGRIGRWVFDSTKEEFELEYFDNDLRGSVELRTDSGGNVLDRRFYSPFGLDVDVSGNDLPMKDGAGFATHAGMADLELLDMKARLFNPRTRRFESTDPIFLGLDTYAYTHNDPINRVDLDGRWDELGSSCRDCWTHGWYSSGSGDQVGGGGIWDQPRAGNGNGGSGRAARKPRPPRPVIAAPSSAPDPGGHGSSGGEYVCDQSIESCGAGSGEAPSTSTSTSSSPSPSPSPTPEESEVQRRITELQEQHQQSLTVDELILNWYSGPPSEASETVDVAAPGPRTAFPVNGNYYGALTGAMLGVRAGKSRLGKVISGLTGGPRSAYRPTWMTQMYAWGIVFDALVIGPSDIPRGDMEHELSNSQYWADRAACAAGDCAGMAFAPLDPDTAHHWQDYNSRICWLPGCAPTP